MSKILAFSNNSENDGPGQIGHTRAKQIQIFLALMISYTMFFVRQFAESKFLDEDHIFSSGTWPKKAVQNGVEQEKKGYFRILMSLI